MQRTILKEWRNSLKQMNTIFAEIWTKNYFELVKDNKMEVEKEARKKIDIMKYCNNFYFLDKILVD